jgi:RHS repeat-associated protein
MHGTQISTSAYGNRFTFQGREYLAALNVYDFRNRAYSPDLGRFLQMDPIGFGGGNNLYRFVGNNPVSNTDPSGELIAYLAYAAAGGGPDPGGDNGNATYSVTTGAGAFPLAETLNTSGLGGSGIGGGFNLFYYEIDSDGVIRDTDSPDGQTYVVADGSAGGLLSLGSSG